MAVPCTHSTHLFLEKGARGLEQGVRMTARVKHRPVAEVFALIVDRLLPITEGAVALADWQQKTCIWRPHRRIGFCMPEAQQSRGPAAV